MGIKQLDSVLKKLGLTRADIPRLRAWNAYLPKTRARGAGSMAAGLLKTMRAQRKRAN